MRRNYVSFIAAALAAGLLAGCSAASTASESTVQETQTAEAAGESAGDTELEAAGESAGDTELDAAGDAAGDSDADAAENSDADSAEDALAASSGVLELVMDIPTVQYFTDEAVAEEDIEKILTAGINAPSAMNQQPWHFSVVTDSEVLQRIADDMSSGMPQGAAPSGAPSSDKESSEEKDASKAAAARPKAGIADAPLAIVISCAEGSELDAGLTCQNMSVAAQLLGYGTKIISSPKMVLNGESREEYQELLGIPESYLAAAVVLVGYEDTSVDESMDGYTGATERNALDDMVTYVTSE